ncbi:MAG: HNH endonuclease, partial [Nocardioidaceae bacterium]|nr:HNH endonuclease [Nocardioidaceae bacterium]
GPVLAEQVRAWAGRADLRVQPVIDLADRRSVDAYEVPARMSKQVLLRDPCCPFPYCSNLSRHKDNDHVVPFDPGDADQRPPPGQTSPDNLAPLCRRHHRIKTHSVWRYIMAPPGTYLWTSPHCRRYRVDNTGTTPLDTG